jgi:citrate lyase beta subunit/acyl dehydratase
MSTTVDPITVPRSCLVVPGHKDRMHEKAAGAAADEVVFDLEDAVPQNEKARARDTVLGLLADPRWRERRVAVRINGPNTSAQTEDIAALAHCDHSLLSIVVPKVGGPEQVQAVIAGLGGSRVIQALIESPGGLLNASAIARHEAVARLIIGYADLAAELGRRPTAGFAEEWLVQREAVLVAARAAGAAVIDGPFFGLRDQRGLAAAAMSARAAGFDGKWAIHPDQVSIINEAFAASESELGWARAVLDALSREGAASIDGAMVDEAMARRARRLLALGSREAPSERSAQDRACSHAAARPTRRIGSPYYDELHNGQVFHGPGVTLTSGHAALHQAIVGDRLRLALDAPLAEAVTGRPGLLVHPMLVCDVAIGQSTMPTGRVLGNLFYRGLGCRPLHVGATVRTHTEVVARRDASGGRGIAALRVTSNDETGAPVLDFWRCPLLATRPGAPRTGVNDDLSAIGTPADPRHYLPRHWQLEPLREQPLGPLFSQLTVGDNFEIEAGETVTSAPELARLSLNMAMTHTDARSSIYGERLVYGGHVIGIAAAHVTRALPDLATLLVWHSCDHLAPTFEGDILSSHIDVTGLEPLEDGGLIELHVRQAARSLGGLSRDVLDWKLVGLMP